MSTSEWPQMDTSAVEISPGTEASSDLFGGDLFGDELLDMYHSAVVGNGGTDAVDSIPNDTLHPPVLPNLVLKMKGENDVADNGSPTPIIGGEYDGLNAFRPSTSMTEFTNLLENSTASITPTPVPELPIVPSDHIPGVIGGEGPSKKRSSAECNAILDPSLPQLTGQPSPNKKRALTNVNDNGAHDQFNSAAVLTKVKEEDLSPVINNNAQNINMVNTAFKNTPDPFGMNMIGQGPAANTVINNLSLGGPVAMNNNITQTSAVAPMSIPVATAIQTPSSNLLGKPMSVNSQQLLPVAHSHSVINRDRIIPSPSTQLKTEESFKVVAQAAVTNLILSAGNNAPSAHNVTDSDSDSSQHLKPVNTTSAHVAALTSNNWVAACAASINNAPPGTVAAAQAAALAAASDPAAAKAARARRATLTADERARQNRDRNREHARNTRLRKKAYVEELKRTLTELVSQRDAQDLEKRHEKQRDLEVREVRYRVMEEFLKLRASGSDTNLLARWVAILEDGFTLTLPQTDYRAMVQTSAMKRQLSTDANNETNGSGQVLRGATECLEDASKVASFINNLNNTNNTHPNNAVTMSYLCDRKHFIMDGVHALLDWTLSTSGATTQGAKSELTLNGCMRATFSPASNKLICAELLFDTGSVSSYLNRFSQYQTVNTNTKVNSFSNTCTTDTDALLDSVLPPVTSEVNGMLSNVALITYEKGDSSDEDYNAQPSN